MHPSKACPGLVLACVFALMGLASAQGPAAADLPRVAGTEVSSEFSWERTADVALDANTVAFGAAPYFITFSITYHGLKLLVPPESVDVLIVHETGDTPGRDASADAPHEAPGETRPVVAYIDALPVPLTGQTADGPDRIKGVVSLEVFQWLVGGETLEFEAFARRFVLAPGQIRVLKQVADDWARPVKAGTRIPRN